MKYFKNINTSVIHFVGIGGIGMSGIAELMIKLGYVVQGSDISNNLSIEKLIKNKIRVFFKHESKNIKNANVVVYSSAIKKNNPELIAAKKKSIPIVSRADMLAELMRTKQSIAIAGSHGKTTTTSLVGTMLQDCNMDPTIVNGGIINSFSSNYRFGLSQLMVVEADESDGSFLKLPHEINIITNIDPEHMEYYKSFKSLFRAFQKFASNIPIYGVSIICIENINSKQLALNIKNRNIITYGINKKQADLNITNIIFKKKYSYFEVELKKK